MANVRRPDRDERFSVTSHYRPRPVNAPAHMYKGLI